MAKFIATVKQGKLDFGSEYNTFRWEDWLNENEGVKVGIDSQKKTVSDEMRGYYFSAVIPVIRSTCDKWENLQGDQIHEIIKKMLFYFEAFNPLTNRVERYGRSVMKKDDWNNTAKAMEFMEIIRQYLADCGREMPDSEEYKRLRDRLEI